MNPEKGTSLVQALDAGPATLPKVGGKGASLARMARAGLPVPPSFLISTDAYRAFVEVNGLQASIVALAKDATRPREDTSKDIRALFERPSISPDVEQEITRAYADLTQAAGDASPLAVRSTATAEDLPGASFAGQHDSFLNVRGEQAVLDAVKRCWSSLWTARALEYRARQGIEPAGVWMAVIVQQMVAAESSGVLFTANPLTGSCDEIVLSASWGLGEATVGGGPARRRENLGYSIPHRGHQQLVARSPSAYRAAMDPERELARRHGLGQSDSASSQRRPSVRLGDAAGSQSRKEHPRTLWASRLLDGGNETCSR